MIDFFLSQSSGALKLPIHDTHWLLQKGSDHQQGLTNTLERLRRGRSIVVRLDKSMQPDPCMTFLIERMSLDWRGFLDSDQNAHEAEQLERRRRLWQYEWADSPMNAEI